MMSTSFTKMYGDDEKPNPTQMMKFVAAYATMSAAVIALKCGDIVQSLTMMEEMNKKMDECFPGGDMNGLKGLDRFQVLEIVDKIFDVWKEFVKK
jgi:hypothetical protein